MAKFIFVTGGVLSSVGKGVVAASIGKILQERGIKIGIQKLDPYINVDPGTMSPYQHGEVFVTADGAETDLDLGHYERFLNIDLQRSCSVSSGQVYARVIERERKGDYLGGTIMVIPHITQGIKDAIQNAADTTECDVLIVEVGGTVGDLEAAPFFEALRQMQYEQGPENTAFVHVTWFAYVGATGELKTKPSQHSLRELRSIGITPDIVVARADHPISQELCTKLAHFSNIPPLQVLPLETEKITYKVPLILEEKGLGNFLVERLALTSGYKQPDWSAWKKLIKHMETPTQKKITIGLVGKYVQLHDAYISVVEALKHAGKNLSSEVSIKWINSQEVTADNVSQMLQECDGIVVPGGFGERGVEGKIIAARWARQNKIPYLGLCLGMQVMCIDLAREFIDKAATSLELDESTQVPVVALMNEQKEVTHKGGTMRLGVYPCRIVPGTKAAWAYQTQDEKSIIMERHRHRFEFNNTYRDDLKKAGLIVSGESPDGSLVEIVELKDHPFMVASQFHPEFLSRPDKPHPLFKAFIEAVL
jgi:CTP synthase